MSNKKYWQNFGDLSSSERFMAAKENEFQEELSPMEDMGDTSLLGGKTPRRDFLKYLGFSTAAAALAAGCEMPVRKAIPYLQKPEEMIPGVSDYYASTFVNGGDAISVVVKQRDGRPIKIEGNTLSPLTKGGTNPQSQASVLDLYEPTRLRHPLQKAGAGFKEIPSFDLADRMIASEVAGVSSKPIVLLTSTINSPTTLQVIESFLTRYPGSRHVQYDAVSHSGMIMANEASYGRKAIPEYHFGKAKLIVSIGADFLGTWLNSVQYTTEYAANRKLTGTGTPTMNRHIQFESILSLTGSNADDRYIHKPSDTAKVVSALLAGVGGGAPAVKMQNADLAKGILNTSALLNANKGNALVVCGSNDVNIQMMVNAINESIGAYGSTISWAGTTNTRKGIDADIVRLQNDMSAGNIGALMVYDCNPVYTYPDGAKFAASMSKVPVTVSFNRTLDETAEYCKYIIPSHHWLESWGDAEPVTGYISLIQPLIYPLFKTRPFQTSLLKWSGNATQVTPAVTDVQAKDSGLAQFSNGSQSLPSTPENDAYTAYVIQYWMSKLGSSELWNKALQDGVLNAETPAAPQGGSYNSAPLAGSVAKAGAAKAGEVEVVLYQKISIGNGSMANNPWLQELPDPITKVTWDNYALMSPALAYKLIGIDVINNQRQADAYEVTPEKPTVTLSVNGRSMELAVMIVPGIQENTIGVALGYGHRSADENYSRERIGLTANGSGLNAYPFVGFDGVSLIYNTVVEVKDANNVYPLAQTQVHGYTEGRPVVHAASLAAFTKNPKKVLEELHHEKEILTPHGYDDFVKDATMYPYFDKPGIKWGMSIDLNTCTGCSACVIACTAENNVSVVGKIQVQRAHEMHWLRIDRYFTGSIENPDVIFQPMLCQHCDNAPCENVCPVAATPHSSEGLNQMTYNRCIGTRYCANNCPYKVRRFNWHDYTGADSFDDNQEPLRHTDLTDAVFQMNDELSRMVLNPDVTVRSRGVMEKCSFCVQRLQDGKLEAKKQEDPSLIRNLKTACSQACPTNAITFGNVNDKDCEVNVHRANENRNFYVLEQLHVLPNVSYMVKIRNTDRVIGELEVEAVEPHAEGVEEMHEAHE